MPVARRKERGFRIPDNFSISDYTDDELRSRYRFGRESTDDELRSRYRFGREYTDDELRSRYRFGREYTDDELRSRYRFGREYTDDELRSRYRFGREYTDDELRSRYRFGREYTDDELRSRYRFGRESTAFLVDLLRDDLESISNPFSLENPGVSSRISIIFSLTWKGCFGAGPSPGGGGNFFHLSLTSCNPLLPSSHRQLVAFPPFSFHAIFLFSAGFSRVRPFSSAHA